MSIGFLPFDTTKIRHAKSPEVIRGGYGWLGVISGDFGWLWGDYGVLIEWIRGAYGVVLLEKVLKYAWRKGVKIRGEVLK